jgi:hypothetical protein
MAPSEVAGLREAGAAGRVRHRVRISRRRVRRAAPSSLRRERPVPCSQRLSRRQRVLVRDRTRRAHVALLDLTPDRVVLIAEAHPSSSLYHDRHRHRR